MSILFWARAITALVFAAFFQRKDLRQKTVKLFINRLTSSLCKAILMS